MKGKHREGRPPKERGRWKRRLALACAIVVGVLILFASYVQIYAAVALPDPPKNWNATQVARIKTDYAAQQKRFYQTDDPDNMQGFSMAVWGDNHNSVQTFDILMSMINQQNVKTEEEIKKLQGEVDAARADAALAPAARDKKVMALEKQANEAIKRRILFAVANGDLTISGNSVQYKMFMKQVKKLHVPFITTPGNHDAKAAKNDEYQKIFGPRYYSFTLGDSYFVMADDANQVRIDPVQMKWFAQELKKSEPYKYGFVFMHVPAFRGSRDAWDKAVTIPWKEYLRDRKNANEIKNLCMQYGVDYLFGSHLLTFDFDMWNVQDAPVAEDSMRRDLPDNIVWSFITGGGGAQLWTTYDARAVYNYFVGEINVQSTVYGTDMVRTGASFDRKVIKSRNGESHYLVEKLWTYAFTDIYNNYWWELLVLVPLFIALVAYLFVSGRRRKRAGEGTP